jgi:hypothetical protein
MVLYGTEKKWRERGYGLSSGEEGSYNSPHSTSCLPFICSMTTSTLVSPLAFSVLCVCVCVCEGGERGRVPPDVIMSSVGGWGGGDVNAVTGSLVQFAEFTAKLLKEL